MFKVTRYPHGSFSWADANSTDISKAKSFYADLMGWTMVDIPMGDGTDYTMYSKDGANVAGISPQRDGMPSVWNSYITVENVDAMVDRVKELGGTVVAGPFDVFDSGRMITIQDPTGAFVNLWQAYTHIGAGLVNTVGAMGWNELATRNATTAATAQKFFGELLGWTFDEDPNQPGRYYTIKNNGRNNGGMLVMGDEEMGEMPPYWMVYFSVANRDEAANRVKELGGKVHVEAEATGVGPFAVVEDSTGGVFTILEMKEPEAWIE